MGENDEPKQDDLGPLIRDGYAAPPPREAFVASLGARLRRELDKQASAPGDHRRGRRGLLALLAAHWRLVAELAACVLVGAFVVPLAMHRPPRRDERPLAGARTRGGGVEPASREPGTGREPRTGRYAMYSEGYLARADAALAGFARPGAQPLGQAEPHVPTPPKPPATFRPVVAPHIPRAGLVGLWLANGNAFDSAASHHGAAVKVAYAPDRHGAPKGAFLFDGQAGLVVIPDHEELDTDDAFTVSAWIKPRAYTNRQGREQHIVCKWLYSQQHHGDFILQLMSDGHLKLWVADRQGTFVEESLLSKAVVPLDRWTHAAATFDRGRMKVYVNGRLDAEALAPTIRHTSRREYAHDDVCIGAKWDGGYNCNGAVDEVAIWSRALSGMEIVALCDASAPAAPCLPRGARADRVLLADGGRLRGAILNERYVLATPFGRMDVPAARAAGLVVGEEPNAPVQLVLLDGQVLVGTLAQAVVRLKLSTGSTLRIPVADLRAAGYRLSDARPAVNPPGGAWVILRGGERLILADAVPPLRLLPACGGEEIALSPKGVLRVDSADPNGGAHRVTFANGSTLTGELRPAKLSLKLQLGRELTIGREAIGRLVWPSRRLRPTDAATMTLRSGDRLLGRLTHETLTVRTRFGDARLRPGDLVTATFDANQPRTVAAEQWDGVVLRGPLAEPAVTIALEPGGPTLTVSAGRIASIARDATLPPPGVAEEVAKLVGRLGAESFKDREAATKALAGMGPRIIPLLRKHLESTDAEVRGRVQTVLKTLAARRGGS